MKASIVTMAFTMAIMAMSYPVRSKMDKRVIEAADFKCEAKLSENIIISILAHKSIEPLPSCFLQYPQHIP